MTRKRERVPTAPKKKRVAKSRLLHHTIKSVVVDEVDGEFVGRVETAPVEVYGADALAAYVADIETAVAERSAKIAAGESVEAA